VSDVFSETKFGQVAFPCRRGPGIELITRIERKTYVSRMGRGKDKGVV
jgi:hypothetical protein